MKGMGMMMGGTKKPPMFRAPKYGGDRGGGEAQTKVPKAPRPKVFGKTR